MQDHDVWIGERSTQMRRCLLVLRRQLKTHRPAIAENETHRSLYGLVVGTAYSLWHALPLIRTTRAWPDILQDAEAVLAAIVDMDPPLDESLVKQWTGGYYLNSARYRVKRLIEKIKDQASFSDLLTTTAITSFAQIGKAGAVDETNPYAVWDAIFAALNEFVNRFEVLYPIEA